VALDVDPAAGPARGAAIVSHGFTRSRRTLASHAQALADAGVLAVTPDLPCTFLALQRPGPRRTGGFAACVALALQRRSRGRALGSVLPALWRDEVIEGASHCDFESPTDWKSRLACGNNVPACQQQVRQGLLDAAVLGQTTPFKSTTLLPAHNCCSDQRQSQTAAREKPSDPAWRFGHEVLRSRKPQRSG
jgi:hypothetical protein